MQHSSIKFYLLVLICFLLSEAIFAQLGLDLQFNFDGNLKSGNYQFTGNGHGFVAGLDGQALALSPVKGHNNLRLEHVPLDGTKDFSIQCWIKTRAKHPSVILSQKNFPNKGIVAQKNPGWVLYHSGGTFAWSIGSGERRINYERENGEKMPINDGKWHQIVISYQKKTSEFRLYYDGRNQAIYKVNFDFANNEPLWIGSQENVLEHKYSAEIESGLEQLQALVDAFNELGLVPLKKEEFIDLIVDPAKLSDAKQGQQLESKEVTKDELSEVLDIRKKMLSNPYTVFQNKALTNLKPVSRIYALQDGKVVINESIGKDFTQKEKLYPSDFALDQLSISERTISDKEVWDSYAKHQKIKAFKPVKNRKKLTVGVWNIWHGGIHWSKEEDGWDSRKRVAEMIRKKKIDVVLMQETYSSGDFIAAELGYYYATTSDWDYRFQGANISVISRYPIKEVQVLEATEFNNVAVKLAISKTQEIWAMSNWYGMAQFPAVFDFHESRFKNVDNIPVLFGGDFNAVPHTDQGDSPASKRLQKAGFTDAYRSRYPEVEKYPGFSHRSGSRIDQLYYKGKGLKNTFTEVISSWPSGFPSDHYLIVAKFKLNY